MHCRPYICSLLVGSADQCYGYSVNLTDALPTLHLFPTGGQC
ncbi:hypothetical protein [Moorena producens]